jgi:PhnB protein
MSEVALTEQLDQAIEAMFRNPDTPLAAIDPEGAELISIAVELRALPRADFKARLKIELEEASMSLVTEEEMETNDTSPQSANDPRATFRTVTPYLTVSNVHQEIEFLTKVFGAEGKIYGLGSAGGYHSEYKIGDSMVMIGGGGEGSNWKGTPNPASLHLYVEDVDAVYERAMQAGAASLMAPTNQEYGDRDAAVIDVGGNHWYIGTNQGPAYKPEGVTDLMPYLHPTGAPKMISFLKEAFGAEEIFVYQSPDGIVHHAKVGIGNSIVEMGEAHGQWQPMPMVFMLYVDDVEAWYDRAMKAAGAISLGAPKDQTYGDRVGALKDPFDNVWYIGTRAEMEKS